MGKKLTEEEYDKKLFDKFNGEYSRLERYIKNNVKILHRHNCEDCNYHEWMVIPANLICKIPKAGCPICGKVKNVKNQRKTIEEIKSDLHERRNNEYSFVDSSYKNYQNNHSKLVFIHNHCGTKFSKSLYHLFNDKYPCPKCSKEFKSYNIKKLTDEEYKNRVPKDIIPLEKYKGYDVKILHRHNCEDCNYHEWMTAPHSILNGNKCPKCKIIKGRNVKNSKNNFYNKLNNDEYESLTEYIGSNKPIKIKHLVCNKEFITTPHKFTSCPFCFKNFMDDDLLNERIKKLVGNEYSILEKYKGYKTKIKFKHEKCNREFFKSPNMFLKGHYCPYCKSSKGEDRIRKYLEDNDIYFQEQYSFNDCKNKLPLKFDFMLEDDSGRIVLIEYDGEFHYNNIYGNLHQQQKRDKIKDDYCDNHDNIDLYRISYKEFNNIETILNEIINSYE